jgi:hypothetical protein
LKLERARVAAAGEKKRRDNKQNNSNDYDFAIHEVTTPPEPSDLRWTFQQRLGDPSFCSG